MSTSWILHHDTETGKFKASFPGNTAPADLPRFVKIRDPLTKETAYLQSSKRSGASNNQIRVSPQTLAHSSDEATVIFEKTSELRYRVHRLFRDPGQRLALVGLTVAIASVVTDDLLPFWVLEQSSLDMARKIALTMLKLLGVVLIFIGAIEKED